MLFLWESLVQNFNKLAKQMKYCQTKWGKRPQTVVTRYVPSWSSAARPLWKDLHSEIKHEMHILIRRHLVLLMPEFTHSHSHGAAAARRFAGVRWRRLPPPWQKTPFHSSICEERHPSSSSAPTGQHSSCSLQAPFSLCSRSTLRNDEAVSLCFVVASAYLYPCESVFVFLI